MLRRGFKSEANWLARDVRRSLGLAPAAPLSPFSLAESLGIGVLRVRDLQEQCPAAVSYLLSSKGSDEFSAVTIHSYGKRLIVHNDGQHPNRQVANISHELAHALLHHPPHNLIGEDGGRRFEAVMEAEANWLGPALLISEEAALWIVEQDLDVRRAGQIFGVSTAVVRMRLRTVGAEKRVAARRAKAA